MFKKFLFVIALYLLPNIVYTQIYTFELDTVQPFKTSAFLDLNEASRRDKFEYYKFFSFKRSEWVIDLYKKTFKAGKYNTKIIFSDYDLDDGWMYLEFIGDQNKLHKLAIGTEEGTNKDIIIVTALDDDTSIQRGYFGYPIGLKVQECKSNYFTDQQIRSELNDIMKEYKSKNVFCTVLNLETNKLVNQVSMSASGENRNLESEVLSYKLISPVIAYSLSRNFNLDSSFTLNTNGSYKVRKVTQDSVNKWAKLDSNNIKNNKNENIYKDLSVSKSEYFSLQDAIKQQKFSIIYKILDTMMNQSLYSNLNEIGINNPFQKKQKIEDLINCYINIYSEDNYLKDSFNSSFLKKLVKQNKYNNVYGIFSTVEKEDRSFESSFIGYIDKLDASYLIFITVDISTYNNVFFYSTSVLDKMISLFDKM